ncbi:hypothetical protein HK100_008022 [Physocladia obscura]|uniref:Branchpoint-bridging protein n=1 Tax=Physocladia obscura TaxID=109957 RepID=A0AAD5SQ50_9FUNG|nr:hypothetical protein HK100_008022 [Physocladia obscura]
MSWRQQSITGTNNIPLGTRRGRSGEESTSPVPQLQLQTQTLSQSHAQSLTLVSPAEKRRSRFDDPPPGPAKPQSSESSDYPRKRRSRWGDETAKVNLPGIPTVLPQGMNPLQIDEFVVHARLEEIGRKIKSGDVVPPDGQRSPSPEPQYGPQGQRVNTREVRYKKKLEDERHRLVEDALRRIPGFVPPVDYKKPTKAAEKYFLPAREFPEINFIGLLIGPRGNTLKKMESESGAKISIRGKGSVKEGKSRSDGQLAPGEEEDLHCLVVAPTEDQVKIAIKLIEKIVETAATIPEGQNELKRMQLRELASLNGTLRDDEAQICQNCGSTGHRKYECPETKNFTATLVCRICGGAGHVAADCNERNNPQALQAASYREAKIDDEYASLMAELSGEKRPSLAVPKVETSVPKPPSVHMVWQNPAITGQAAGSTQPPNWGMPMGLPVPPPGFQMMSNMPVPPVNPWAAGAPTWIPPPPAPTAASYYPAPPTWMPPPPPPPSDDAPPPPPPE